MRSAIYARVSTKDQSCEMQMRDLRPYCAARGFAISREFIDVGQSGAKDSRPQLNELMADALEQTLEQYINGSTSLTGVILNPSLRFAA